MTSVFGVTQQEEGVTRKVTRTDASIAPRLVLYDPLLTLDLPPRMTAGTGINAVAHCIEALYSIDAQSTLVRHGVCRVARHCPCASPVLHQRR